MTKNEIYKKLEEMESDFNKLQEIIFSKKFNIRDDFSLFNYMAGVSKGFYMLNKKG